MKIIKSKEGKDGNVYISLSNGEVWAISEDWLSDTDCHISLEVIEGTMLISPSQAHKIYCEKATS